MIEPTSSTRKKVVRLRDASGNLQSPDAAATPTLVIYADGAAWAATVTWAEISAGIWRYSYTTPAGSVDVDEYLSATVDAAAGAFDGGPHREYRTAVFGTPGPFAGDGAYPVVVTIEDGDGNPLEGATVRLVGGITGYHLPTDADGEATFQLNAGTYDVYVALAGYSFAAGQEHVVSSDPGTQAVTFEMTQVVVTPSADPELTTAYLTIRDSQGNPVADQQCVFQLVNPADVAGTGWRRNRFTGTSDENGLVQVQLPRSAQCSIRIGGRITTPGTFTTGADDTYAIPEQLGYLENA